MEVLKREIDLLKIGGSLELYHHKDFREVNKKEVKSLKYLNNKYIFCFNIESPIEIVFPQEDTIILNKFHSFICYGSMNSLQIKLNHSTKNEFIIILIEAPILKTLIENCDSCDFSSFIADYKIRKTQEIYLSAIDKLLKISRAENESLSSMEIIGYIYMLLNASIKQYVKEISSKNTKHSSLKEWEKCEIEKITTEIRKNPELSFTLNKIAEKYGICIPHLQQGFKEMHNMTVFDFIRDIRLSLAENLLRKSENNISEIVYDIGLSSRSYFSKIFKQKYKCTPSEYKNRFKNSFG